jgi:hypothetical protein
VTDPYGRILGFLDRSRYYIFQVAPQFYSRGCVDPDPDPLLLRKSGSAGNGTQTSGYVARTTRAQRRSQGSVYTVETVKPHLANKDTWLCNQGHDRFANRVETRHHGSLTSESKQSYIAFQSRGIVPASLTRSGLQSSICRRIRVPLLQGFRS